MAPNKNRNNFLLEAINLQRSISLIENMEQLIDLRRKYIKLINRIRDRASGLKSIPEQKRLLFFKNDSVEADEIKNGGAGVDFYAERAKIVSQNIDSALNKWIDLLGNIDLEDYHPTTYDIENKILNLKGKKIRITQRTTNYPADLLATLFKNPKQTWEFYDIATNWPSDDITSKQLNNRIYQAGKSINEKISQATTINDFLHITTKAIQINPKYL